LFKQRFAGLDVSRILAIFLLLSACYLGLGYVRSESALIHAFDTGLYLQLLNNLLAGCGWMSSIVQESTFLAHHFQPLLVLLPDSLENQKTDQRATARLTMDRTNPFSPRNAGPKPLHSALICIVRRS